MRDSEKTVRLGNGRYELLEKIATGGMAEIYLARDTSTLDRLVVIKKILPHLAEHDTFVDMFKQEARFIARLVHPNIVQIYELSEDEEGAFFIAMEYVPGISLRQLMRTAAAEGAPIPIAVGISLIIEACRGAHVAHELADAAGKPLGLVHRDISPHNLMVTSDGTVKLLDFGIAKATEIVAEQTKTGALKGKVHYMSPEQCQQKFLDRRSDIFALGIVLWELMTARRLFKRDSELSSMQAIVSGDRWNVKEFREDVPDAIADVIDTALASDKNQRYESADDFKRALMNAAERCKIEFGRDTIANFVNSLLAEQFDTLKFQATAALAKTKAGVPLDEDAGTLAERPSARTKSTRFKTGSKTIRELAPKSPSGKRRAAIAAIFFVAALGFLISRALPDAPPDGPALHIGLAPVIDPKLLREDLEPIRQYLQRELDRPVAWEMTFSYGDLVQRLLDGEIPYGSLPPYAYIQAKSKNSNINLLASKRFDGSAGSDGYLVVVDNAGIDNLEDLRGKTLCYTDEKSTTSYMLPRAALRDADFDPERDFKWHRSGNHLQVLRDLDAGKCSAGGTYSGAYLAAEQGGVSLAKLRVLKVTGRAPQDAICSGPAAAKAEAKLLKDALLRFDPMEEFGVELVGTVQRISGFAKIADVDYDSLRGATKEEQEAQLVHQKQDAGYEDSRQDAGAQSDAGGPPQ